MINALAAAILYFCTLPSGQYASHLGQYPAGKAREIAAVTLESATTHRLDPILMVALAHHESNFDRSAVSVVGAFGIWQTMPALWGKQALRTCLLSSGECLRAQADAGARALAFYVRRCGTEGRALTAYRRGHCGPPGPEALKVLETRRLIRALGWTP